MLSDILRRSEFATSEGMRPFMEELLRHGTAAPAAFNETQDLLSKLELTQLNDAAAASSVDIETPLTFGFEHVTPELRRRADEQFQLTKLNSLVPQPVAPLTPPAHETVAVAAPSPELPDVLLNKRKPEPQQSLESQLVAMVENAIADQPSQPQPELSDEEAPQPELSDEEAPPPPPVVTEKKKSKKEKHKRKHAEKKKKKKQRDTSPQRVSTKTKQHVAEKSAAAKPEPSPPAKEKRKHTEEKAAPEKKQKLDDPLLDLPPPPRAAATAAALPARESLPRRSRPTKIIDPIYLVSSSDDEAEESNGGGSAKRSRAKAKPPPPPIESASVSTVAPPLLRLENAIDRSLRDSRGGSVNALMSELAEPRKLHRKLFDEFCQLARSVIGLLTGQLPRLDEQALETRVRVAARKVWPDQAQHWPFIEFGGYSSVQHGADTIKIQLATGSQTASFSFTDLRTTLTMTSLWIAANPRALLIRLLAALETERQRLEDIDQEREFAKAFRVWFNFTVFSRFHHGLLS